VHWPVGGRVVCLIKFQQPIHHSPTLSMRKSCLFKKRCDFLIASGQCHAVDCTKTFGREEETGQVAVHIRVIVMRVRTVVKQGGVNSSRSRISFIRGMSVSSRAEMMPRSLVWSMPSTSLAMTILSMLLVLVRRNQLPGDGGGLISLSLSFAKSTLSTVVMLSKLSVLFVLLVMFVALAVLAELERRDQSKYGICSLVGLSSYSISSMGSSLFSSLFSANLVSCARNALPVAL
jgi:hypothetical protein